MRYLPSVRVRHDGAATASREVHLPDSAARFADKHIHSRLQRRVMPPRASRRGGLGRAARPPAGPLILLLHNRYRAPGGEERAVEDLAWLIRDRARRAGGRAGARLGGARRRRGRRPACWAAGCGRRRSRDAVRRSGARVVHAHNVWPAFGWRALAAAREAGARVVLHLHNYRLVCAVGDLLHARRGLHALPRPQHAAGRAAELPRLARRGGRLRGVAGAVAAAAGRRRSTRSSCRARSRSAGSRSWARRSAAARASSRRSSARSPPARRRRRGASRSPPGG